MASSLPSIEPKGVMTVVIIFTNKWCCSHATQSSEFCYFFFLLRTCDGLVSLGNFYFHFAYFSVGHVCIGSFNQLEGYSLLALVHPSHRCGLLNPGYCLMRAVIIKYPLNFCYLRISALRRFIIEI